MRREKFEDKSKLHSGRSALLCGFLLSRGISGGARCVGWEMPALTENNGGSLWGAAIFALACAVCCVLRRGCTERTAALLNALTAAAYTLHCLLSPSGGGMVLALADGAAVLAALIYTSGQRRRIAHAAVLALLLLPLRLCALPPPEPLPLLRLSALSGALYSAGFSGAAIALLPSCAEENSGIPTALGIAAGLIPL